MEPYCSIGGPGAIRVGTLISPWVCREEGRDPNQWHLDAIGVWTLIYNSQGDLVKPRKRERNAHVWVGATRVATLIVLQRFGETGSSREGGMGKVNIPPIRGLKDVRPRVDGFWVGLVSFVSLLGIELGTFPERSLDCRGSYSGAKGLGLCPAAAVFLRVADERILL